MEKRGRISLVIRDGDFSAEVAWMGHGLQMWLQTMWFLTRNIRSAVLILDEPDVYLHADLQRKLARMLLADSRQVIIATHSPEIIAEVTPDSIVVLDKGKAKSSSITSAKAVQQLLIDVGSVHNLSLVRLASIRRILFVEGDDIPILKAFQNVIFPNAKRPIDTIPHTDIGGWSGWPSVLTFAQFLRQNANSEFEIFCFLDRDYHTDSEIASRTAQAKKNSIRLCVWPAKELENYAVMAGPIARLISRKLKRTIDVAEVEASIDAVVESMREDTFDACAEAQRVIEPRLGVPNANKKARAEFNKRWAQSNGRLVVGGKTLLSGITKWSQDKHGKAFSLISLIGAFEPHDITRELKDAIKEVTDD
jgi:energy-coupling factor transporter ATP-binding protein EcfA2